LVTVKYWKIDIMRTLITAKYMHNTKINRQSGGTYLMKFDEFNIDDTKNSSNSSTFFDIKISLRAVLCEF